MSGNNGVDKSAYGKSKLAQWGVADDQLSNREKWICFWALFAFAVSCVYQWQMIAPILTNIAEVFGVELGQIGWLMSVYTFAGLILAYPCTWVMQNFGIKFSLIVTVVLGLIGNVLCLFATSAGMFMVGRAIQGCGFGLISVLGPNIMPRLFPLEKQGLIMGVWSQWVAPGIILSALTTAPIFAAFGWQGVYYLSTALTAITGVLLLVFVKMPCVPENLLSAKPEKSAASEMVGRKTYVKSALVVGFVFLAWAVAYGTIASYMPTFGQQAAGMGIFESSMILLVVSVVSIPVGIFVGWLADRIRRRKLMLLFGYAFGFVLYGFFLWKATDPTGVWIGAILVVVSCALVPGMSRAIIPVLAQKPKQTDWALTGMGFVTQLGTLVSIPFATIMASSGWGTAGFVYSFFLLAAVIIVFFIKDDHDIVLVEEGKGA